MLKRLLSITVLASLLSAGAAAQWSTVVITAVTNDGSYLYISGVYLGPDQSVFLSGVPLSNVVNAAGTQITATLPAGLVPAHICCTCRAAIRRI